MKVEQCRKDSYSINFHEFYKIVEIVQCVLFPYSLLQLEVVFLKSNATSME